MALIRTSYGEESKLEIHPNLLSLLLMYYLLAKHLEELFTP